MLNKDLFKNTMKELLSIHGIEVNEIPVDMPKLWYEELKGLKDEEIKRKRIYIPIDPGM